jgi:hypothetical protein
LLESVPKRDNCAMDYLEMSLQQSIVPPAPPCAFGKRAAAENHSRAQAIHRRGREGVNVSESRPQLESAPSFG